jgi:short-subunit dehydrogenase involved in D-alanine esterification of teichoic acids
MQNKVLILGGYGNFGKYIASTLLQHRIPVILGGRKKYFLEAEKQKLQSLYKN